MSNEPITAAESALIDKLVGSGSPKEQAFVGGANTAASRASSKFGSWQPPIQSADMDILPNKMINDARGRDIAQNDAYVQAGQNTHKDSIVGGLFMLNAKPEWEVLGRDEDWAQAFQKEAETLFTLWAESPMHWVDAAGQLDLTSMIRLAVGVSVLGGETLATVEYIKQRGREFKTAIQMIDADRLSTPYDKVNNDLVRGGIRHDNYGRQVSAYIRTSHPMDYGITAPNGNWWKEVQFRKPWGRQQVIFLREQKRVDQTRGVADIVAGLRETAITRKFRDITLQNAVVNATYAASIESELPPQAVYEQLGGKPGEGVADYATKYLGAINDYVGNSKNMQIDGVRVPHLFPGTKLNMRPAGTPGGVGQDFEKSLLRYIAASLNISYEELSRDFSATNYSSAKAAMALTFKYMQGQKKLVADAFANIVYRLWLEEAINNNRLKTFPASEAWRLYTDNHLNLLFDALSKAVWIGAARGQVDELKETQAAVLRIKYHLSTHEDELARLGKDWRKVFPQLERERVEREERGLVLEEDNSVNAASGSPREPDEEDEGTNADDKDKK
jgi:lambda family phage portal protein